MNNEYLEENIMAIKELVLLENVYKDVLNEIINCFKTNHKLIFMGNGGSGVDASHTATDFLLNDTNKFKAISLTDNIAYYSSLINDYKYEETFTKQIEVLAEPGDVIIGITTSGKSINVLKGLDLAKSKNLKTILITGKNVDFNCDYIFNISSTKTTVVQNVYKILFHMLAIDTGRYFNEHRN